MTHFVSAFQAKAAVRNTVRDPVVVVGGAGGGLISCEDARLFSPSRTEVEAAASLTNRHSREF